MRLLFFIELLLLCSTDAVAIQNGNFTTLSDAIPQLAGVSLTPPLYPWLGTMNVTNCCLSALNETFMIRDGYLIIVDDSFLSPGTTPESFLSDMAGGQFACGSDFNGTEVKANYSWCSIHCPGWQRSRPNDPKEWVSPLVSFILPCLVFSTTIPRRKKLNVDVLSRPNSHDTCRLMLKLVRFAVAVIITILDVLMWLALCFAFSGPMILSGVFEAFLDSRILNFVSEEKEGLSKLMSTRLLYIILVGNLDFKWENDTTEGNDSDPWLDLEHLLKDRKQEVKLPSMVEVQNSYGTTVGIPIAFFCGGFIYNLFDIQNSLGNNDTAHSLAFGLWWIVLPHMAIISSLLLAGNNPSIFQIAVNKPTIKPRPVRGIFAQAYESRYKTKWLWSRGRSKYLWLQRAFLLDETEAATKVESAPTSKPPAGPDSKPPAGPDPKPTPTSQLAKLQSAINFSILDWARILIITTALIFAPFILAFLTSFYTPTVGLSCRSMTFLLYFLAQMGQVTLWSPVNHRKPCTPSLSCIAYWTLATLFVGTSIFTAIGGTIMQLLGVYSNCLCALPAKYWSIRYTDDANAYVNLGSNSAADISAAQHWWMSTGSVATGILCAATYFGWWYQRGLRGIFRDMMLFFTANV